MPVLTAFMAEVERVKINETWSSKDADNVWTLYSNIVSKHKHFHLLDKEAIKDISYALTRVALELDASLKLPKAKARTDLAWGKSLEEVQVTTKRIRQLISDARRAKIPVAASTGFLLIKLEDHRLGNFQSVMESLGYLSKSGVPIRTHHIASLLRSMASSGNYTGVIAALHHILLRFRTSTPLRVPVMLALFTALSNASTSKSENLDGYPVGPTFVADLHLPLSYRCSRARSLRYASTPEAALHKIEIAPDPLDALKKAMEDLPPGTSLLDLVKPNMPVGSSTVVEKGILFLCLAKRDNVFEQSLSDEGLAIVLKPFLRARHPRLARAVFDFFTGVPHNVQPGDTTYHRLVDDAVNRKDKAQLQTLIDEIAERNLKLNLKNMNNLIRSAGDDGDTETVEILLRSLRESGLEPNDFTIQAGLAAIFKELGSGDPCEVVESLLQSDLLSAKVANEVLTIVGRRKAGIEELERVWNYPGFKHNSVGLSIMINKHSREFWPNLSRIAELVSSQKEAERMESETWSAVLRAFSKRSDDDPALVTVVLAMIRAIATKQPVEASDIPLGAADLFPLVNVPPPVPRPGLYLGWRRAVECLPKGQERDEGEKLFKEIIAEVTNNGQKTLPEALGLFGSTYDIWTEKLSAYF